MNPGSIPTAGQAHIVTTFAELGVDQDIERRFDPRLADIRELRQEHRARVIDVEDRADEVVVRMFDGIVQRVEFVDVHVVRAASWWTFGHTLGAVFSHHTRCL